MASMHLDKRQVEFPLIDIKLKPTMTRTLASIEQHPAVERVRRALHDSGANFEIIVMPEATHTAAAAAAALGCELAAIAKSIVFRTASDQAVLVITSGVNRVDEKKVVAQLGVAIQKADADFVLIQTGFVIGGVAPVAHLKPPLTLIDASLMSRAWVYPAAGHPNTMFKIEPKTLAQISGATIADIAKMTQPT